jgi:putative flippase GtrA
VHFVVLVVAVDVVHIDNLAVSNFLAGVAGISSSFIGNKFYVFQVRHGSIHYQAIRFVVFYACILSAHTFVISLLTDYMGMDYRISFVFASALMLVISFLSNKYLVFKL